jgi:hypothetical protein
MYSWRHIPARDSSMLGHLRLISGAVSRHRLMYIPMSIVQLLGPIISGSLPMMTKLGLTCVLFRMVPSRSVLGPTNHACSIPPLARWLVYS